MASFSLLRRLVLMAAVALCSTVQAQTLPALRIGVAPHSSARVILEMYQPLRQHMEKTLGIPVEVVTAQDFTEFARRMLHQDYDIAITTGHMARLSQTDADYIPMLTYRAEFRTVALVAGNSSFQTVRDLKGKPIVGLSPSSLVTLWGQHWLKQNGIPEPIRYVSASDSVARLVLAGDAAAGFISMANYQSLARDIQPQLRFLVISDAMPGRAYMLNNRNLPRRDKIEAALWSFAETPEGKSYFDKYKLDGYRKLKPRELESMDPYAQEVRQTLR